MSNNRSLMWSALLLLLSALLLWGGHHANNAAQGIVGPLAVAADDEQVAVAAPGLLYRLDPAGNLLNVDTRIIAAGARDAGLQWLAGDLLVSPGPDGTLQRCTDTACTPFSRDPYAPVGPVHAAVDDRILWLVEAEADRLHRFRIDGTRIDMPLSNLVQPGAAVRAGDAILVCNTGSASLDSHRLHKTGVDHGEKFTDFTFIAGDERIDRPLRIIAAGRDGFHALFTNVTRSRGLLVRIDSEGTTTPVAISGAELSNPVSITRIGDDLLVVDEDLMQVLRIDSDGGASVFGDADFNAQLSAGRTMREVLRNLWPVLVLLSALTAAIGSSWLMLELARHRGDPAQALAAGSNGIVWMPTEQERLGQQIKRNLMIAAPAALLPALAAGWLGSAVAAIAWVLLVAVAAAVPAYLAARRAQRPRDTRIGLRGKRLVVADTENGLREFPLGQVQWSESRLQPTSTDCIDLVRDGIPLYHQPTLVASLFPQLDPARRVAPP